MNTNDIVKFLSKLDMFSKIVEDEDKEAIRKIASLFRYKKYPKSDTVIRKNDPGVYLFIVASGKVEVLLGGNDLGITFLKAKEVFGEMSLLSGDPVGATIKTVETTGLLYAESSAFNEILDKYPPLQMYFARLLRQRLAETNKETESSMGRLKAAYKISEATHTAQNLEELYPEIHEIIGELMNAENFHIFHYDPLADMLTVSYYVNEYRELPSSAKEDFSGYVLKTQKPLFGSPEVIKKLIKDGEIISTSKTPVRFWLGVPLKTRKKTIGVMAVHSYDEDVKYGKEELDILLFISEQIAMAIERVRSQEGLTKLVSRLKQAQGEIAEKEELLTRSIIASDFVHNLNNLAGTIPVWANALKEKTEDMIFEIQRDVKKLLREGEKLKKTAQEEKIDINTLLESLLNNVRIQYAETEIKKEISDELYPVQGVKPYLSNAIYNVILNGIESVFEKKTRTVTVKAGNYTENNQNWVKIEIADTGEGISEKDMERIFEHDFTIKGEGRGYGLWRAKNTIEKKCSGRISVSSQKGKGASFTILLPGSEKDK